MIELTSTLWIWNGEGGRWHFLSVPEEMSVAIRAEGLARRKGFGSVRVEACINGVRWRTSVFPQRTGGYILPVKAAVRRDAAIAAGDNVTVSLQLLS